jgi:MFS family permease
MVTQVINESAFLHKLLKIKFRLFLKIPGAWLAFKFGGKRMIASSMGIGSLITILIPFCARLHYLALIICLFLTGVAHGAFWPSISSFWTYWAPHSERTRLVGMATSGARVGNIVALTLGSVLCIHGFDGGWPSLFYLFGIAGVIWTLLVVFITADSPADHRFISQQEKEYILEETKKSIAVRDFCQKVNANAHVHILLLQKTYHGFL